jgi:indole-3-glycerol phosphate synthase/phosphoribosylanthranilate isomerase
MKRAIYGGLIFVDSSPRAVSVEQARKVIAAAPLSYVGVFRNADIADVAAKADALSLSAVQLHGDEDQAISMPCVSAGTQVQIWKAQSVGDTLPARNLNHVDKYVLDNGQGGTASVLTGRC